VFICLTNRKVTPDLGASFYIAITNYKLTMFGVFNSLPLVIFSYMYQTNIPMIYTELAKKENKLKSMWKILLRGTIGATIIYMIAGVFGYVTFA